MTSRFLRPILALKTPIKSFQRFKAGGPGEFREIPYYGFAPKYRDEFAKLKIPPPDPPLISGIWVIVGLMIVVSQYWALQRYVKAWRQEAEHRRNTEYRAAMIDVVDNLSKDYRKILDARYPN